MEKEQTRGWCMCAITNWRFGLRAPLSYALAFGVCAVRHCQLPIARVLACAHPGPVHLRSAIAAFGPGPIHLAFGVCATSGAIFPRGWTFPVHLGPKCFIRIRIRICLGAGKVQPRGKMAFQLTCCKESTNAIYSRSSGLADPSRYFMSVFHFQRLFDHKHLYKYPTVA